MIGSWGQVGVSLPLCVCVCVLRSPQAQNELTPWGLSFEDKLLSLKGRVLPTERIIQGSRMVRRHTQDELRVARCKTASRRSAFLELIHFCHKLNFINAMKRVAFKYILCNEVGNCMVSVLPWQFSSS